MIRFPARWFAADNEAVEYRPATRDEDVLDRRFARVFDDPACPLAREVRDVFGTRRPARPPLPESPMTGVGAVHRPVAR